MVTLKQYKGQNKYFKNVWTKAKSIRIKIDILRVYGPK